jgi:hypothetical protein
VLCPEPTVMRSGDDLRERLQGLKFFGEDWAVAGPFVISTSFFTFVEFG